MKIEFLDEKAHKGFDLEIKRCYLPFKITSQCPKCGVAIERDLTDRYLSYPKLFVPIKVSFAHEFDDEREDFLCAEWDVTVILCVTMEQTQ